MHKLDGVARPKLLPKNYQLRILPFFDSKAFKTRKMGVFEVYELLIIGCPPSLLFAQTLTQ